MTSDRSLQTQISRRAGLVGAAEKGLGATPDLPCSTVTIVITTFNHGEYLGDAIASTLHQERAPDKIIVVDDGSTDNSDEIVAQFDGIDYIRQENKGLSAARNTGLKNCATDYIAFLDADDRLLPGAMSRRAEVFHCKSGLRDGLRRVSHDIAKRHLAWWRAMLADYWRRSSCIFATKHHRNARHGALSPRALGWDWWF